METYEKAIFYITFCLSLAYPLLYLRSFVRNNKAFKIFTCYLLIIGVIQLLSKLIIKVFNFESNLFLSHYYFILQFILLSIFYHQLLKKRWIYYILGVVLILLGAQYVGEPELYFRYNSIGMFGTQVILVMYALIYMYQGLSGSKQFTIVNVGIFFYLLSSSLIFASGNLVFDINVPESFSDLLVDINKVLYLLFQILIITEWYRNYRKPKPVLK